MSENNHHLRYSLSIWLVRHFIHSVITVFFPLFLVELAEMQAKFNVASSLSAPVHYFPLATASLISLWAIISSIHASVTHADRRWFQYDVRTLLILTGMVALGIWYWVAPSGTLQQAPIPNAPENQGGLLIANTKEQWSSLGGLDVNPRISFSKRKIVIMKFSHTHDRVVYRTRMGGNLLIVSTDKYTGMSSQVGVTNITSYSVPQSTTVWCVAGVRWVRRLDVFFILLWGVLCAVLIRLNTLFPYGKPSEMSAPQT